MLPERINKFLPQRQDPETEFLPAALEVMETPASPLGRIIAGLIVLFFVIALLWAFVGKVDIVATASGKILPSARSKTIQPFETGVVRSIHVQDGQQVRQGDVLVEIDSTITAAERDRVQKDWTNAKLAAARFRAALNFKTPKIEIEAPEGATPEQISLQQTLLVQQVEEIQSKLKNIDSQIAQAEGNRTAVQAQIQGLTQSIPLLEQRNSIFGNLAEKGYGSKLSALSSQQQLIQQQQELASQRGRLSEAGSSIAALRDQRRTVEAEYKKTVLDNLTDAEQKATSLSEQLAGATQRYNLQTITAPVDGTVQQLAIHTEGGVVTPAQNLMIIVPRDSKLEIEAMISNRDIGFVSAGDDVQIKIDTFNFTKYGLLHGKVTSISQDAIPRANPGDPNKQQGALQESSEPKGQELVYAARISLEQTQMQVDDKMVNLSPGMAVTAEIKTGSRRVIEYLLSPLARHKQQAFQER